MKHYKMKEVPATSVKMVEKVICDLCQTEIKSTGSYNVDDVTVEHRLGVNYPEGGSGEETSFDICSSCFTNRLSVWLKSQGANSHVEEWDY